jgi:AcrR family transcriptional regulator
VIAVDGVSAPTARIAKIAGVAEGTLFTYFNNKDELLNELYLQLKSELREVMVPDALTTTTKSAKSAAQQAWTQYVSWGVAHPQKRKVLAQLGVSERVTEQSKAAGMVGFTELNAFLSRCVGSKVLDPSWVQSPRRRWTSYPVTHPASSSTAGRASRLSGTHWDPNSHRFSCRP